MLLPHCRCVVALHHVEKQHLVFLEVAGALTTTSTFHGRSATIIHVCCTVVARVETTFYACVQKQTFSVALYSGMYLIFVWLLLSYQ
jgi:hypothetical protein